MSIEDMLACFPDRMSALDFAPEFAWVAEEYVKQQVVCPVLHSSGYAYEHVLSVFHDPRDWRLNFGW